MNLIFNLQKLLNVFKVATFCKYITVRTVYKIINEHFVIN